MEPIRALKHKNEHIPDYRENNLTTIRRPKLLALTLTFYYFKYRTQVNVKLRSPATHLENLKSHCTAPYVTENSIYREPENAPS